MILHQKKHRKTLSVAEKPTVKIVALPKAILPAPKTIPGTGPLMPPRTQFNMGYLKEKEHDPL